MRTEVKIGIIIGLVVIAVTIIYLVDRNRRSAQQPADVVHFDAPASPAAPGTGTRPPGTAADRRPTPRTPGTGPRPTTPPGTALTTTPPRGATPIGGQSPEELRDRIRELTGLAGRATDTPATRPAERPAGPTLPPPATQPVLAGETPPPPPGPQPGVPVPPAPGSRRPDEPSMVLPGRPAAAAGHRHTVAEGETLWAIAEQYFGDGHKYRAIAAANPGINPDLLLPGQVLVIPPKEEPAGARPPAGGDKPGPPTGPATGAAGAATRAHTYVVERGDTLISIARAILKDGARWREIYELNKTKIANPDVLLPGLELKLPEK